MARKFWSWNYPLSFLTIAYNSPFIIRVRARKASGTQGRQFPINKGILKFGLCWEAPYLWLLTLSTVGVIRLVQKMVGGILKLLHALIAGTPSPFALFRDFLSPPPPPPLLFVPTTQAKIPWDIWTRFEWYLYSTEWSWIIKKFYWFLKAEVHLIYFKF